MAPLRPAAVPDISTTEKDEERVREENVGASFDGNTGKKRKGRIWDAKRTYVCAFV